MEILNPKLQRAYDYAQSWFPYMHNEASAIAFIKSNPKFSDEEQAWMIDYYPVWELEDNVIAEQTEELDALEVMTKKELMTYARVVHEVFLDSKQSKANLIEEIRTIENKE